MRWKLDALLGEPGDVPEIAILDAVVTEGDRGDSVGEDFLAALRPENESRGAEVDSVKIAQHHRPRIVAGNGADIEIDPLSREMLLAGACLDDEFPSGDVASDFHRLAHAEGGSR